MLYVKCVCVLSRDLSPVVVIINGFGICYMLKPSGVCVLSRYLSPVVVIINGFGICYMLNVFVCCPVISAQW